MCVDSIHFDSVIWKCTGVGHGGCSGVASVVVCEGCSRIEGVVVWRK